MHEGEARMVRFQTQAAADPQMAALKRRLTGLLGLQPGQVVLDAGCGQGGDLSGLAAAVAPGGRVVGVDMADRFVARARERTAGLPVEVLQADVRSLPFPDGHFDAVRTDRMVHHVAELEQAVAELVRVTRPGGTLAFLEPDRGADRRTGADLARLHALLAKVPPHSPNPDAGLRLFAILRRLGVQEVAVEPAARVYTGLTEEQVAEQHRQWDEAVAAGALAPAEADWLRADLAESLRAGTFVRYSVFMLCRARKPGL